MHINAKQDKAARVAAELRRLIARDHPPGDLLPTQQQLAARLRVGLRSVNAAVRLLAQQGVVCAVQRKGTVVQRRPADGATALSRVALVLRYGLANIFEGYAGQIASGLSGRLDECQCHLAVFPAHRGVLTPLDEVVASGIDGAILQGVREPAQLRAWAAQRLPVVVVDHCDQGIALDYLVCDNAGAVDAVLGHLVGLGHRHFEYVAPTLREVPDSDNRERLQAVVAARTRLGLASRAASWPASDLRAGRRNPRREAFFRLLRGASRPTAILVDSGFTAVIVLQALAECGLRVPADVSVAAVARHAPRNQEEVLQLTCALMDFRSMGRRAVERLLERTRSPAPTQAVIERIGFTLHHGGTTAAPLAQPSGR